MTNVATEQPSVEGVRICGTWWPNVRAVDRGEAFELSWAEFVERLRPERGFAGDTAHPGWSPARFEPLRRSASTVRDVSALVLDYDGGTKLDEACALWARLAGVVHTTRKHTSAAHRFRVILPLSRLVTPTEHATLWKRAQRIAIAAAQILDASTRDASRFWYLPGVTDGGAYELRKLEGAVLDVDAWLADEDTPQPGARYVEAALRRAAEAVRAAPEGTRNAKLNTEAYSLGGLVGAGALDEGRARRELGDAGLAAGLPVAETQRTIDRALRSGAARPRATPQLALQLPQPPANDTPPAWHELLSVKRTQYGEHVKPNLANLETILANDERWRDVLAYNELRETVVTRALPPWHECDRPADLAPGDWTDGDSSRLAIWFSRHFGLDVSSTLAAEAAAVVAQRARFHPFREYLDALTWDGVPRLDALFVAYAGGSDDDYTRSVGARWLISAVARTFEPGCQVDCIPVLEGPQGVGKSTFGRILAGDAFFADDDLDIGNKDAAQSLKGKVIIELGELSVLGRAALGALKGFVTRRIDHYRPSFGRYAQDFARRCVFIATTNDDRYLRDATGNRRWWPVRVGRIDLQALRRDRDQLWAEAVARYEAREPWHVDTSELAALCAAAQEERFVADPWEEAIGIWLAEKRPDLRQGYVTVREVLRDCVGMALDRCTRGDEMRAGDALKRLGWAKGARRRVQGVVLWPWLPAGASDPTSEVGTEVGTPVGTAL